MRARRKEGLGMSAGKMVSVVSAQRLSRSGKAPVHRVAFRNSEPIVCDYCHSGSRFMPAAPLPSNSRPLAEAWI